MRVTDRLGRAWLYPTKDIGRSTLFKAESKLEKGEEEREGIDTLLAGEPAFAVHGPGKFFPPFPHYTGQLS